MQRENAAIYLFYQAAKYYNIWPSLGPHLRKSGYTFHFLRKGCARIHIYNTKHSIIIKKKRQLLSLSPETIPIFNWFDPKLFFSSSSAKQTNGKIDADLIITTLWRRGCRIFNFSIKKIIHYSHSWKNIFHLFFLFFFKVRSVVSSQ